MLLHEKEDDDASEKYDENEEHKTKGTQPGPFFLFFYKVYKRPLTPRPPPLFYKVTL